MALDFDPVAAAVEAHFVAAITAVRPGIKIAREGVKLTPPPNAASELWLRLRTLETDSRHPYAGRRRTILDLAIVQVECFAPPHSPGPPPTPPTPVNYSSPIRKLADDVRKVFVPSDDGLRIMVGAAVAAFSAKGDFAPRIVHVGEVTDQGLWLKRIVRAPYTVRLTP